MLNKTSQALTSVFSILLSFLAASHHGLHMALMLVLGGSTNGMASMSSLTWVRRLMIAATLLTAMISVYRLFKHRCKSRWIVVFTMASALLSLGFILYTLVQFGW